MAVLYLVPNLLDNSDWQDVLPAKVFSVVTNTRYFIVENIRTARRFLKKINKEIDIDNLVFFELNKHTQLSGLSLFVQPLEQGNDVAVITEAGCPGIADPGAEVVRIAHQRGYRVVPIAGPSSILLALMASGLNGQNFSFNGYLPVKTNERRKAIARLEDRVVRYQQTQIFIETPYRNNSLIKDLLLICSSPTLLCIAANLTAKNEFIATKTIKQWKKQVPDLHKQPAIFLVG